MVRLVAWSGPIDRDPSPARGNSACHPSGFRCHRRARVLLTIRAVLTRSPRRSCFCWQVDKLVLDLSSCSAHARSNCLRCSPREHKSRGSTIKGCLTLRSALAFYSAHVDSAHRSSRDRVPRGVDQAASSRGFDRSGPVRHVGRSQDGSCPHAVAAVIGEEGSRGAVGGSRADVRPSGAVVGRIGSRVSVAPGVGSGFGGRGLLPARAGSTGAHRAPRGVSCGARSQEGEGP
jgi:hypothetical protein